MSSRKEAAARIKINRLLEEAGWRFFDSEEGKANIALELHTKVKIQDFDAFGNDFEKVESGFVDFLLLDEKGFPLAVLEAKSESIDPLSAKEQARTYARELDCRFVILSNGNLHYLWDIDQGNPHPVSRFPDQPSLKDYRSFDPDPRRLTQEKVDQDYIALTQLPNYRAEAGWINEAERASFIARNHLQFLRPYQVRAIQALQRAAAEGKDRYLFEMATGTGKTLTTAAVIKLFLRTGNARRVLFLVDRLELEDQAQKQFTRLLKNDYTSVIYKENRSDWRKAEIVVTTVQSLLFNNKFRAFAPTDFDLVVSDEAHRSINGNARAVFEYFVGYKLGLTATPKNYLKNVKASDGSHDPRDIEKRILLDTYRTFGCESGEPTFSYTLLDGVNEGYLVNPFVIDARTEITTKLLSEEGYAVIPLDESESFETYEGRHFEKKFFSEPTNKTFCVAFLQNALRDPVTSEIGKSIVYAVSQRHAAKLTQILNEIAHKMFPGKYQSDFAVQVTSNVQDAKQLTINFANNNLLGTSQIDPEYRTSKARVCVTVGMMTTGYDCPDILNLALMRPVFSPSEFVQIKGRGTRRHNFLQDLLNRDRHDEVDEPEKKTFRFFDFFGNYEYFEEHYDYDQTLELPAMRAGDKGDSQGQPQPQTPDYENFNPDPLKKVEHTKIGPKGMRVDRKLFERFEEVVKADDVIKSQVEEGNWNGAAAYLARVIFDKPEEYFNLDKLRKSLGLDRRVNVRELLEKAFGLIDRFKSKDELLEDEFEKFLLDMQLSDPEAINAIRYFFKAYVSDEMVRTIVDLKDFARLSTNATLSIKDYAAVPEEWRSKIPEYVKDYVPLNQFMQ